MRGVRKGKDLLGIIAPSYPLSQTSFFDYMLHSGAYLYMTECLMSTMIEANGFSLLSVLMNIRQFPSDSYFLPDPVSIGSFIQGSPVRTPKLVL